MVGYKEDDLIVSPVSYILAASFDFQNVLLVICVDWVIAKPGFKNILARITCAYNKHTSRSFECRDTNKLVTMKIWYIIHIEINEPLLIKALYFSVSQLYRLPWIEHILHALVFVKCSLLAWSFVKIRHIKYWDRWKTQSNLDIELFCSRSMSFDNPFPMAYHPSVFVSVLLWCLRRFYMKCYHWCPKVIAKLFRLSFHHDVFKHLFTWAGDWIPLRSFKAVQIWELFKRIATDIPWKFWWLRSLIVTLLWIIISTCPVQFSNVYG